MLSLLMHTPPDDSALVSRLKPLLLLLLLSPRPTQLRPDEDLVLLRPTGLPTWVNLRHCGYCFCCPLPTPSCAPTRTWCCCVPPTFPTWRSGHWTRYQRWVGGSGGRLDGERASERRRSDTGK